MESPKAYLATITTRLAIDQLRSARVRRETYVGPWLPEPLVSDTEPDVAEHAEMSDSLSTAFLVLLESLTPSERAVFLLREAFDYDYAEIASILDRSEASCRQLLVRARKRIDADKPRFEATRAEQDELARRFFAAIEVGDLDGLVDMLAADAVWTADGGGKTKAVSRPVYGRKHIGKLVRNLVVAAAKLGGERAAGPCERSSWPDDVRRRRADRERPQRRGRGRRGAGRSRPGEPGQAEPSRAHLGHRAQAPAPSLSGPTRPERRRAGRFPGRPPPLLDVPHSVLEACDDLTEWCPRTVGASPPTGVDLEGTRRGTDGGATP